jgi:predicted nucleic acid-binding protein
VTPRFADTYFYLALLDEGDQHHARVSAYAARHAIPIITTRWVLTETANALAGSASRATVAEFLAQLEADPEVQIAGPTDALYQRGLTLYARRADKTWSLTDCISFVVMEDGGVREALTGDRHFAQAGFVPVFAAD